MPPSCHTNRNIICHWWQCALCTVSVIYLYQQHPVLVLKRPAMWRQQLLSAAQNTEQFSCLSSACPVSALQSAGNLVRWFNRAKTVFLTLAHRHAVPPGKSKSHNYREGLYLSSRSTECMHCPLMISWVHLWKDSQRCCVVLWFLALHAYWNQLQEDAAHNLRLLSILQGKNYRKQCSRVVVADLCLFQVLVREKAGKSHLKHRDLCNHPAPTTVSYGILVFDINGCILWRICCFESARLSLARVSPTILTHTKMKKHSPTRRLRAADVIEVLDR